jgi:hypothetical protein
MRCVVSVDSQTGMTLFLCFEVPFKLFRAIFQHLDEAQTLALEEVKNCGIQEYVIDRTKNPAGRMKLKSFNFIAYKPEELSNDQIQITLSNSDTSVNSGENKPNI